MLLTLFYISLWCSALLACCGCRLTWCDGAAAAGGAPIIMCSKQQAAAHALVIIDSFTIFIFFHFYVFLRICVSTLCRQRKLLSMLILYKYILYANSWFFITYLINTWTSSGMKRERKFLYYYVYPLTVFGFQHFCMTKHVCGTIF